MKSNRPATDLGPVIEALDRKKLERIVDNYAIGGAFAAILHAEPLSTIDLDIFFLFAEKQPGSILTLDIGSSISRSSIIRCSRPAKKNGGKAIPEAWRKWHAARHG